MGRRMLARRTPAAVRRPARSDEGAAAEVKAKISSVVGAGTTLTYTNSTPTLCAANSTVTADALVNVQRTFVPATPLLGVLQLFGGGSVGTITIHATGAMSCVG